MKMDKLTNVVSEKAILISEAVATIVKDEFDGFYLTDVEKRLLYLYKTLAGWSKTSHLMRLPK
mgnify:CR=1 FL=1